MNSAATGNWSAGATWVGGVAPTNADTAVILTGHTVTINNTSCVALSVTVNSGGTLNCAAATTSLTVQNGMDVSGTFNLALSGSATQTCNIALNNARAGSPTHLNFNTGATVALAGFSRKRMTRLLTAVATTGAASTGATVSDATGWQIGDVICLGTTQAYNATPRTDLITLTSVNTGTGVIGWTGSATYTHDIGAHVGNFTSNVVIKPAVSGDQTSVQFSYAYASSGFGVKTFSNVSFLDGHVDTYNRSGAIDFNMEGVPLSANIDTSIVDSVFYNFAKSGITFYQTTNNSFVNARNVFYTSGIKLANGGALHTSNTCQSGQSYGDVGVFRCTGTQAGNGYNGADVGVSFSNSFFAGCTGTGFQPSGTGYVVTDTEVYSNLLGVSHNNGTITASGLNVGTFNAANGSTTTNGNADSHTLLVSNILTNSSTQTLALTGLSTCLNNHNLTFINKGNDVTVQEIYRPFMTIKRNNATTKRSTSSVAIAPTRISTACTRTLSIPCANGASVRIIGYVQKSHATNVSATVALSGLGSAWGGFTKANDTAWEKYDTGVITNSSGADGNYTLTYTANSSSGTTNVVYFDGVPDSPFVTKCRHYGYTFDEANPNRTANASIQEATEATALAYTNITISGSTSVSPWSIGASKTFQQVYDYSQAYACANLTYTPSFTATGAAGTIALVALANATTTGFTLDGGGSLSMGAFTLTANQPWPYTFTGGTFSQGAGSGLPAYAGGTLTLSSTGTRTLNMTGGQITFSSAGTYTMSASTLASSVNLVNTSGGSVTVVLPAGASYTNTGPNITISSPTVTQGLAFTGLVAGSQVVVYTTTTTTELFRDDTSATSETWSQAGGSDTTVDYTIMKAGYLPIRVVGVTVNSAVVSTPIVQTVDRAYAGSSGLTFGTTATVNAGTSRFTLTTATTGQNWYSFMIESWIAQSALRNVAFPLATNGPNSFTLDGWEFSAGITYIYRDGIRYIVSGVATAIYAALYSVDTASGLQVKYQQTDGGTTTSASNTGKIDQLIQVYGDASHGNFDRRSWLTLKIQKDGYDQAESDVFATYGTLEDQLYIIGLNPSSNGLATGAPTVNGSPTITDEGGSPVTWHSKAFSITITDSAAGNTGETLMRWIRYNIGVGGTFQGKDGFNWHDLVQVNGDGFKTVRGAVYGDTGATLKGVRVITSTGADHPDFNLHTADDGTTYVPVFPAAAEATVLADTRVQLYNVTTAAELDNSFVTGTAYSFVVSSGVTVGDTVRLRACKKGRMAAEATAVWSADGVTFLISQPEDTIYTAWGIDGATVSEYSLDGTNLQIDANDVDGSTQKTRLAAYYSYALTLEAGMRLFYGALTFLAAGSIRVNVDVIDTKIDNVNATTALVFTDINVRLFRSDGSSIIAATSNTVHSDYNGEPFTVETGVSGLTGTESAQLLALPSASATADAVWAKTLP